MTTQTTKSDKKIPKLRFGEFSGDWKERKLGEVADIITGNTPKTSNRDFYNGEYLFVSPADISDYRYVVSTKTTLTKLGFDTGRLIKKGGIFFVCIGSTIGKIAQASVDSITNQQINSLVSNKKNINNFLYNLLDKNSKRIKLLAGIQAVPILNKTEFSSIKFNFPSLPEQQKIANFLTATDNWIENLKSQKETLEKYKKGMMQKIFSQKIRFKDENGKDFTDWKEKKLGEVLKVERGGSPRPIQNFITKSKNGVPWIKIGDIKEGAKFITSTKERIIQNGVNKSRKVKIGDFILSNSMSFGRPYILKINGCIHDGWLALRNEKKDIILDEFLYELLGTNNVKRKFLSLAAGSAVKNLKSETVKLTKISFPSLSEQQKIANFLTSLDNQIEEKNKEIEKAEIWKKGLMQGLFV